MNGQDFAPIPLEHTLASNGKFATSKLTSIGGSATLLTPAAKSWLKMVAAAKKDGITLASAGAYRPYSTQVSLFTARYTTAKIPTVDVRIWGGVRYYRKPGMAATAVPGTSNHGLGVAIDVANAFYAYGSPPSKIVSWLNKHAKKYGWVRQDWTYTRALWEPWHWEYDAKLDTTAQALKVDGVIGKATYSEWQRQLGKLDVDGIFGAKSVKRLETRLNGKNGKGGFKLVKGPLKVDGKLDSRTITAVQKLLNVWVARGVIKGSKLSLTGKMDYATVVLLQRSLNADRWD
jgi:LAS superfamily LD-carboxypeptidase LdcB